MNNLRFVILLIIVLGTCVTYITRTSITVALNSMVPDVNKSPVVAEISPINNTAMRCDERKDSCGPEDASVTQWLNELGSREYTYTPVTQGILKSSFFATYIILQIPAATYAKRYGAKWFIVTSLIGSTIVSLLTPFVTDYIWLFVVTRTILGIFQSLCFPCSFVILENWMPLADRTFALAALNTGSTIGSIITFATSGYIVAYLNGWPSLFFVYGLSALVVSIITISFVTSSPTEHPLMSPRELNIIADDVHRTSLLRKDDSEIAISSENNNELRRVSIISSKLSDIDSDVDPLLRCPPTPWIVIWQNKPFLVTVLFKFTNGCIFMILYTEITEYLKMIFDEDVQHNGLANSFIQGCYAFSTLLVGYLSERIIERNILTRTSTRKTCGAICGFTQALCLVVLPFITDIDSIHIALCFVGFFLGFTAGAETSLPSEMSKNFGAQLYSVFNITAVITGLIVPNIVSLTLCIFPPDHKELAWNFIFYSFAALNFVSTLLFVIYVRADRQPFDFVSRHNSRNSDQLNANIISK